MALEGQCANDVESQEGQPVQQLGEGGWVRDVINLAHLWMAGMVPLVSKSPGTKAMEAYMWHC